MDTWTVTTQLHNYNKCCSDNSTKKYTRCSTDVITFIMFIRREFFLNTGTVTTQLRNYNKCCSDNSTKKATRCSTGVKCEFMVSVNIIELSNHGHINIIHTVPQRNTNTVHAIPQRKYMSYNI